MTKMLIFLTFVLSFFSVQGVGGCGDSCFMGWRRALYNRADGRRGGCGTRRLSANEGGGAGEQVEGAGEQVEGGAGEQVEGVGAGEELAEYSGDDPDLLRAKKFLGFAEIWEQARYSVILREIWENQVNFNIRAVRKAVRNAVPKAENGEQLVAANGAPQPQANSCALYVGGEGLDALADQAGHTTPTQANKGAVSRDLASQFEQFGPKQVGVPVARFSDSHEHWRVLSGIFASSELCSEFHVYLNLSPKSWREKTIGARGSKKEFVPKSWRDYFHRKIFFMDELPALLENESVKKLVFHPVVGYTFWHGEVPHAFAALNALSREVPAPADNPSRYTLNLETYRKVYKLPSADYHDPTKAFDAEDPDREDKEFVETYFPPTMDGSWRKTRVLQSPARRLVDRAICDLAREYSSPVAGDEERFAEATSAEHISESERSAEEREELKEYSEGGRNLLEMMQTNANQILAEQCFSLPSESAALYPSYFEKQESAHCGKHALNNALGQHKFTSDDLLTIRRELNATSRVAAMPDDHWSDSSGDFFELEVLRTALLRAGYDVKGQSSGFRVDDGTTIGAIVNTGGHWVAMKHVDVARKHDGEFWWVDSIGGPRRLTREEYEQRVEHYNRSVQFIVPA